MHHIIVDQKHYTRLSIEKGQFVADQKEGGRTMNKEILALHPQRVVKKGHRTVSVQHRRDDKYRSKKKHNGENIPFLPPHRGSGEYPSQNP